ncbi:hypothetical protein ZWY2020_048991 [Hordeum vulgare]|nr:hypothetical protein ZWY2020_048991 [Hordeum vulgare]
METISTNEDTGKGAMWELEKSLDQPMDAEARRLRNMYREKTYPTVLMLQLAFQSLGVVFGDLGTSPLYVFYNIFPNEIEDTEQIIGALSLIIYYPPEYRPINVFVNFYSGKRSSFWFYPFDTFVTLEYSVSAFHRPGLKIGLLFCSFCFCK